jgi:hypothetical protein
MLGGETVINEQGAHSGCCGNVRRQGSVRIDGARKEGAPMEAENTALCSDTCRDNPLGRNAACRNGRAFCVTEMAELLCHCLGVRSLFGNIQFTGERRVERSLESEVKCYETTS